MKMNSPDTFLIYRNVSTFSNLISDGHNADYDKTSQIVVASLELKAMFRLQCRGILPCIVPGNDQSLGPLKCT